MHIMLQRQGADLLIAPGYFPLPEREGHLRFPTNRILRSRRPVSPQGERLRVYPEPAKGRGEIAGNDQEPSVFFFSDSFPEAWCSSFSSENSPLGGMYSNSELP